MDFTKPIYAEFIEDEQSADEFRAYLKEHGIEFTEEVEDYMYIDGFHIFACNMTKEQLKDASDKTQALFYQ